MLQLVAGQHPCTIQAVTAKWLEGTPFTDAQVEGELYRSACVMTTTPLYCASNLLGHGVASIFCDTLHLVKRELDVKLPCKLLLAP